MSRITCYAKACADPQLCSMVGSCQGTTAQDLAMAGLNLYPSEHPHAPAGILADRQGLALLRSLIDQAEAALGGDGEGPVFVQGKAFDTGGEGHDFRLVAVGDLLAIGSVTVPPLYPDEDWGEKLDIDAVASRLEDLAR